MDTQLVGRWQVLSRVCHCLTPAQAQAHLDNKLAGDDGQIEMTDISKVSNDKVQC